MKRLAKWLKWIVTGSFVAMISACYGTPMPIPDKEDVETELGLNQDFMAPIEGLELSEASLED